MRRSKFGFHVAALLIVAGASACSETQSGSNAGGSDAGDAGTVGAGDGGTLLGPCGLPDVEPNDTRMTAMAYAAGTKVVACLGQASDVDHYVVSAPASDVAGGYYTFTLTQVGPFAAHVQLWSEADNGRIGEVYARSAGQNFNFYFAIAPGNKVHIAVAAFAGVIEGAASALYTLEGMYHKVDDAQEPNDTRDTAKPLVVGTPVSGLLFTGIRNVPVGVEEYDDWYDVTLAAGAATLKLTNLPSDGTTFVELYDPTLRNLGTRTIGAGVSSADVTFDDLMAGPHKVRFSAFSVTPYVFGATPNPHEVPDSFKRSYALDVTQP